MPLPRGSAHLGEAIPGQVRQRPEVPAVHADNEPADSPPEIRCDDVERAMSVRSVFTLSTSLRTLATIEPSETPVQSCLGILKIVHGLGTLKVDSMNEIVMLQFCSTVTVSFSSTITTSISTR